MVILAPPTITNWFPVSVQYGNQNQPETLFVILSKPFSLIANTLPHYKTISK